MAATLLPKILSNFNSDLIAEILAVSHEQDIPKGKEILREGQFAKAIPFVLKGLINVSTRFEDKELLLYYIRPEESCVMSFFTCVKNEPSKIFALAEEDTKVLLLPVESVSKWIVEYPEFNNLFFKQYNLRYNELLDTIHKLLYDKMDKRLFDFINEKITLTKKNPIKITHQQIASELSTAREVVSRTLKKLEHEGKLIQHLHSIEIL